MQANSIQMIKPLWDTMPTISGGASKAEGQQGGIPVFSDIFNNAISQAVQAEDEKNKAEYLLATGQLDNPAIATIAGTKASLSLDFLIQLRQKALDAYSELSRMSV